MAKTIFINLPVADLAAATAFYEAIGAEKNPKFSDDTASAFAFSDAINLMLLSHDKFRQFTPRPIADAKAASQVLLAISADSRAGVDQLFEKAIAAGGRQVRDTEDYGLMYSRPFEDLDGHIWEPLWVDPKAAEQGMSAFEEASA